MKINLVIDGTPEIRVGYLNIDMMYGKDGVVVGNFMNLNPLVDDGEAEEIFALDILDYLTLAQGEATIAHWVSKLAHGGTLVLSAVDIIEVSKALIARIITVDEANSYLHGEQKKQWQFRHASYTLGGLVALLEAKGLQIQKKRISSLNAIVVAIRP